MIDSRMYTSVSFFALFTLTHRWLGVLYVTILFLHFLYCLPSKLALDASQHCSYKALFGDSVKKCDNGKFVTCFSRFEYDVNFLSKKFRCTRSNSRTSSHGGLSFVLYFFGWTFKSN